MATSDSDARKRLLASLPSITVVSCHIEMALGWLNTVYRQAGGGRSPAQKESAKGARLAIWQCGLYGLDWMEELVKAGTAVSLGGNGYPKGIPRPPEGPFL
jgi:hypothetical protein